ncbi:MAG: hypothetical protein IJ899_09945 [Blautia sp.]|nr:hypothetical protein [Blautia sp.]
MIKGKTESGFEFEYDEAILSDWEYITKYASMMEALNELQEDEKSQIAVAEVVTSVNSIFRLLLGKDGDKKVINHLRSINGSAGTKDVVKELREILTDNSKSKN